MDSLVIRLVRGELSLEGLRRASGAEITSVIQTLGLEDAHEIIHALSARQLRDVLDEDIWTTSAQGEDELDPGRFVTWLQVLGELGREELGRRLLQLDEELLIGVLCRLFHVLTDEGWRQVVAMSDHPDLTEKRLADAWVVEIGDWAFFACAPVAELAVDALVELHARDKLHCDYVFDACCRLSFDRLAARLAGDRRRSQLDALLSDVADARDVRRARSGFVPAPDARAWLSAIAAAPRSMGTSEPGPGRAPTGVAQAGPPRAPPETLMARLRRLAHQDEAAALAAGRDLVRLANIMVAGADVAGRALRPLEAMGAVTAACDIGLELAWRSRPGSPDRGRQIDVEAAFVAGWRELQPLAETARRVLERLQAMPDAEAIVAAERVRYLAGTAPAHPRDGAEAALDFVSSLRAVASLSPWCEALLTDPSLAAPTA